MIVTNKEELTPIEFHNGIYFKRDDLFQPYKNMPISGGKVRQMIYLIENRLKDIKENYANTIISGVSVESPQAVIISTVANAYGLNCILVYGNTKLENLQKKKITSNALKFCTRLEIAKASYQNVLDSYVDNLIHEEKPYFKIKFGINLENNQDAIINSVADQVKNIPNDIDLVVVPAGSAIMFSSILKGMRKYNKSAKVIGIQISGLDMSKTINKILDNEKLSSYNAEMIIDKTYNYHKKLKCQIAEGFELDPIYESKAYEYMNKHILPNYQGKNVLFWVVGNSKMVR